MNEKDTKSYGNQLHAYTFAQRTVPHPALAALREKLLQVSTPFSLAVNQRYNLSPDPDNSGIILMDQGIFSIGHVEDDFYTGTMFSPSIVGFIDAYSLYYNVELRPRHFIYADTACTGFFIKTNDFLSKADEFDLWHDVSRILAHRLMVLAAYEREHLGVDAYAKIRSLLNELWLYPEEYRSDINVSSFLQRRSGLSRSQIMRVLSELRKGGYLEITLGKLKNMSKLPSGF